MTGRYIWRQLIKGDTDQSTVAEVSMHVLYTDRVSQKYSTHKIYKMINNLAIFTNNVFNVKLYTTLTLNIKFKIILLQQRSKALAEVQALKISKYEQEVNQDAWDILAQVDNSSLSRNPKADITIVLDMYPEGGKYYGIAMAGLEVSNVAVMLTGNARNDQLIFAHEVLP